MRIIKWLWRIWPLWGTLIIALAHYCVLKYFIAKDISELDLVLESVMNYNGPVLCEIMCPENQEIIPATASLRRDDGTMVSKPLEDMYPFLSREEFKKEMINKPLEE